MFCIKPIGSNSTGNIMIIIRWTNGCLHHRKKYTMWL